MTNQTNYDELDDLFSGGGAPAASFKQIGDSISGVITHTEVRTQRDFDTDEPLAWPDGKPMKELVLTLQTSLRDKDIEDDDGSRRLFCRGQMLTAFRQAVKKAKDKRPQVGARVTVTFSDEGEQKKRGFNKPKLFTVAYEPSNEVAAEELFDEVDEVEEVKPAAKAKPAAAPDIDQEAIDRIKNMDPAELAALLASR